jgi:hypothetical protein
MAASRFIRFFSRRQTKNSKILSNDKSPPIIPIKNGLVCTIIFLDGEDINFEVDVSDDQNSSSILSHQHTHREAD